MQNNNIQKLKKFKKYFIGGCVIRKSHEAAPLPSTE
jgi:hypothetical protein